MRKHTFHPGGKIVFQQLVIRCLKKKTKEKWRRQGPRTFLSIKPKFYLYYNLFSAFLKQNQIIFHNFSEVFLFKLQQPLLSLKSDPCQRTLFNAQRGLQVNLQLRGKIRGFHLLVHVLHKFFLYCQKSVHDSELLTEKLGNQLPSADSFSRL